MHPGKRTQGRRDSRKSTSPQLEREFAACGPPHARQICVLLATIFALALTTGCYVPLRSPGIDADCLPNSYRTPMRSMQVEQNLAALVVSKPDDYLLGPDDVLSVVVRGLAEQSEALPIEVQVMADGTVTLPLVGAVEVAGMNVAAAQNAIDSAYKGGVVNPRVSISLAAKATMDVTVIGEVKVPGVYALPRYQNDIAQALGMAGGLTEFATEEVTIHRRMKVPPHEIASSTEQLAPLEPMKGTDPSEPIRLIESGELEGIESVHVPPAERWVDAVIRIPLRGGPPTLFIHGQSVVEELVEPSELSLRPRDVVTVARKVDPVFFVVGPLSRVSAVNFTISDRDRQLGNAFLLPEDRDIDVVTAVAMAGYIDPIESPSTVTVQRSIPGGSPQLIRVDLIDARYSWKKNLYVQPGDIIYLNPDALWWSRRTFDRIIPELLLIPYAEGLRRWINPLFGNNN